MHDEIYATAAKSNNINLSTFRFNVHKPKNIIAKSIKANIGDDNFS